MKKAALAFIIPLLILCSCVKGGGGTVPDTVTPSGIIDKVYEAIPEGSETAGYIPQVTTKEITPENERYFLGIEGVRYVSGAASEGIVQPLTYSFCVVIFDPGCDYDGQRILIEQNVNRSKWVCASAEEALVVRYRNSAAVIMGTKKVCAELETAFLSVMKAVSD